MADTSKAEVLLRLPGPLLDQIKDYRHVRRFPSRTDAILRLIRLGLEADRTAEARVGPDA